MSPDVFEAVIVPPGPVTIWVRGGLEFTGTEFVYDRRNRIVHMVRTTDGMTIFIDIDAVDAFTAQDILLPTAQPQPAPGPIVTPGA